MSWGSSTSDSPRGPSAIASACGLRRKTGTQRLPSVSPSTATGSRVRAWTISRSTRIARMRAVSANRPRVAVSE